MSPLARLLVSAVDRYRAAGGGREVFWVECGFEPSCSAYAREAVIRHGALRGARLALARIRRCRGAGDAPAADPVPERDATC